MSKIITIKIDGKIIQTTEGSNLLQVAHDNEIHHPRSHKDKKLTPPVY